MNVLYRLELVGINVVTSLAKVYTQVMRTAGLTMYESLRESLSGCKTDIKCLEVIVKEWVEFGNAYFPPTWRSLLNMLRQLNMESLSQQIEECFHGKQLVIVHLLAITKGFFLFR